MAMSETETRRSSKADHVYRDLKESILSGALEPGGAIDKLALCERLGVSRFPVSSAINRLAFERLVTVEPQHGSFVAKISIDDVRERLLVRRALEAEIAAQAAERMPNDGVEALERNLRYQQAAVEARDVAGFYALDVDFHRLLPAQLGLAPLRRDSRRPALASGKGQAPPAIARRTHADEPSPNMPPSPMRSPAGDAAGARAAMHHHLQQTTDLFETFAMERSSLFSR